MADITIICSSKSHPIYPYLEEFINQENTAHNFVLASSSGQIKSRGDLLFLVSCKEIIKNKIKALFEHTLVLHASDLPSGRGWSPHIWDILSGSEQLTLSLLEVANSVDTGDLWKKVYIPLNGTELYNETNELLFSAEIELIKWASDNYHEVVPQVQVGEPTYYKKRSPEDSCLDIERSIAEQFNLLRVCDPDRFPAYFDYAGQRYTLKIEKVSK